MYGLKNLYYFAIEYSIFSVIIAFFLAKAVKAVRDKKNKNNVVMFIVGYTKQFIDL